MSDEIADVPRLLRLAADQIEKEDKRIQVILDRIEAKKIFVGVIMHEPSK